MNDHTYRVLEYLDFLELLAEYACSAGGKDAIRALRPAGDRAAVGKYEPLIAGFLKLRRSDVDMPRAYFDLPDDLVRRARPIDSVLSPDDFMLLRKFLVVAAEIHAFLVNPDRETDDAVRKLGTRVHACPDLRDCIDGVFDRNGEIRDNASTGLLQIRRNIRTLEARLRKQLEALLSNPSYDNVLQEKFIAMRNDRFVIPVRRELRSRLPGVVHDQSNSGRTLFVEPQITLEAGNELGALRLQERDEIRRILAELSTHVRENCGDMLDTAKALCRYDLVFAASHWARDFDCEYPGRAKRLRLINARHPLLHRQFRRESREDELVALDLTMPRDKRVMAITGSNTGGKTVALKTLGLLALIYQTGLPVTADPDSQFSVFSQIVADIGDEQSLEQNLSTFSAHVIQIRNLLESARTERTLALIDELGSGTDPVEGGALGCAVLAALCETDGLTFVTTHLGVIKHYVHQHDAMINANVRFNLDSLKPEYVVQVGRPGASYALVIAERYDMPADVLDAARDLIGTEAVEIEGILAELDGEQRRLTSAADEVGETLDSVLQEREELRDELTTLRKERKKLLRQAQKEAAAMLENTRRKMDRMLAQAKQAESRDSIKEIRDELEVKEKRAEKSLEETQPRPDDPLHASELKVGMHVSVEALDDSGKIIKLRDNNQRATIEIEGKPFDVRSSQLGRCEQPAAAECAFNVRPPPPRIVSRELNLIGTTVDDGVYRLEQFLSDALVAGLEEVRVVHGFGTGRLREGVHNYLRSNSVVKRFRLGRMGEDAGGGGATLVYL